MRADLQRQRRSSGVTTGEVPVAAAVSAPHRSKRLNWVAGAAALAAVSAAGYWSYFTRSTPRLTETDTIVLGDFANTTGDAVFDDALRQGLIVQLQQSPYLHVLPDQNVRRVLTMMGQPLDARLTSAVALEVCQRSTSAAVISGSIASLGNQYVLGLTATDCRSGELLDTQQSQVPGKENVLGALSEMASAFRMRAGESLAMIRTHEKPLQEATTASLEALKAYSAARRAGFGCTSSIPLLERAVELDPEFALAHASLGVCYSGTGQRQLSLQSATRAYELRQRATDRERFFIEYAYDRDVTGDLEKAFQGVTVWTQTYPRDLDAHGLRGGFSAHGTGRYEDVLASSERALAIDPDFVFAHGEAVSANMFLDRFDAAKRALQRAGAVLDPPALVLGYYIAMLETTLRPWIGSRRKSRSRPILISCSTRSRWPLLAPDSLGARGRSREKHSTLPKDVASAKPRQSTPRRPRCGRRSRETSRRPDSARSRRWVCRTDATSAMRAASRWRSQGTSRDRKRWRTISSASIHATPSSNSRTCRPCARSPRLARNQPAMAIELLQANVPYERAVPATAFNFFFGSLYPVYVRGQAYAASELPQMAAAEFQKILDHPGLMMGDPAGARARLEKARSLARAGNLSAARTVYEDFLALWKNADLDVPILAQAKAEYSKLQ